MSEPTHRFAPDDCLLEASTAMLSLKGKPPYRQIARGEIDGETVAISYHANGLYIQISFQEPNGEWDRYEVSCETLIRQCYARRIELATATNDSTEQ